MFSPLQTATFWGRSQVAGGSSMFHEKASSDYHIDSQQFGQWRLSYLGEFEHPYFLVSQPPALVVIRVDLSHLSDTLSRTWDVTLATAVCDNCS